ncbi:uncharacterized protein LOC110116403 [Dendrobium catenatum]|uniref:uncharacterized protein LOC110116403 n=1 Tax=Dendrobium catenatum TaxID=906689 RepID=UPI0009F27627|nr:uncharacterized protein LOC110116403 [Dendrobium catenatum]
MERWTPEFSSSSMKGLSSPIWIRMPHLPLQSWDEYNIARIASRVGTPLMLDGNLFHWGRREFTRVCVRINLDQKLPVGVWVDSMGGRFFQKLEYERISSLCFDCGKIGHEKGECKSQNDGEFISSHEEIPVNSMKTKTMEDSCNYGPWILVNNERKKGNGASVKEATRRMADGNKPQRNTWKTKTKLGKMEITDQQNKKMSELLKRNDIKEIEEGEIVTEKAKGLDLECYESDVILIDHSVGNKDEIPQKTYEEITEQGIVTTSNPFEILEDEVAENQMNIVSDEMEEQ